MSEKKSNGQVPEEGPDGKNLEQSEKKESRRDDKTKEDQQTARNETAHPDCNMRTGFRRLCVPGILCIAPACTAFIS